MLSHAFEAWQALWECLHTDACNLCSRAAIGRMGGKYEEILRAHRPAADYTPGDSVRRSILRTEWPAVKQSLRQLMGKNS